MIVPLGDRILVERINQTRSAGGIELPGTVGRELQSEFFVVAISPHRFVGNKLVPHEVEVKDIIIANSHAGTEVMHNGRTMRLIGSNDVLAKIMNPPPPKTQQVVSRAMEEVSS